MSRDHDIVEELDLLTAALGFEKSAEGDPGTTHPAEATMDNNGTVAAIEGERSTENSADMKSQNPQGPDSTTPAAGRVTGNNSAENTGTATFTGEDPKVENNYRDNLDDPGTSHPASADNKEEKYASAAKAVLDTIKTGLIQIPETADTMLSYSTKIAAYNKKAEDAEKVDENELLKTSLLGAVKTAALVGELTADYLDGEKAGAILSGLRKMAEDGASPEDMAVAAEVAGDELGMSPEEAMGAADAMPAEGGDDAAVEQAVIETAAELGVSPEEVVAALSDEEPAEAEGGDEAAVDEAAVIEQAVMELSNELGMSPEEIVAALSGEEPVEQDEGAVIEQAVMELSNELGVSPEEIVAAIASEGGAPAEAAATTPDAQEMVGGAEDEMALEGGEKEAAVVLESLIQKSAAFDELMTKKAETEKNETLATLISKAVKDGLASK